MATSPVSGRVHHGLLSYTTHLIAWVLIHGLAMYGSVACLAPHSGWSIDRPRWWRDEARTGVRACERFLSRG